MGNWHIRKNIGTYVGEDLGLKSLRDVVLLLDILGM